MPLNPLSSTCLSDLCAPLPCCQVVKALDVLYELLRSSPPREQVQAVLLEWGVEQLYCLLLLPSFGDEARERVFRVRTAHLNLFIYFISSTVLWDFLTMFPCVAAGFIQNPQE